MRRTAQLAQARELAALIAPLVFERIRELITPRERYVKGVEAIAKEIGVSDNTLRKRGYVEAKLYKPGILPVPICGMEEFNYKGSLRMRPVARAEDLKLYRENISRIKPAKQR